MVLELNSLLNVLRKGKRPSYNIEKINFDFLKKLRLNGGLSQITFLFLVWFVLLAFSFAG